MNFKKIAAVAAASAVAVSAMAVSAFAVDAHTGRAGYAAIAYAGGDWNAQYWLDGNEYASIPSDVVITGAGTYTVTMEAKSAFVDEETGEDAVADGTSDLAFAALQIEEGETLFPGIIVTIDSVKFDGVEAELNGTPYTSSDDGVTTRVNLYNEWVGTIPDDARTIDGLAADATPKALNNAFGEWSKMEVTFTVDVPEAAAPVSLEDYYNNGTVVLVSDDGSASLCNNRGIAVTDVYGYRLTCMFDGEEFVDKEWIGGGIGTNSNSTGWASTEWGRGGVKDIDINFETGVIELLSDTPLFAEDDAYAQLWIQTWGGTVEFVNAEVLGKDGVVLAALNPGAVGGTTDVEGLGDIIEEEPVVEAGDVDAATDSSKGSPDTGVADVAAVAGLALVAGAGIALTRKRK